MDKVRGGPTVQQPLSRPSGTARYPD